VPSSAAAAEHARLAPGKTFNYRIKAGEHLYRILRDQLKLSDEVKLAEYYALVKDLNPERQNWDNLLEGEVIRLPVIESNLTIAKAETITVQPEPRVTTSERSTTNPQATTLKPPVAVAPPAVAIVPAEPVDKPSISASLPSVQQTLRLPARDHMELFARVAEALGSELQQRGEEVVTLPDGAVRLDKSSYPVVYHAALRQRVVIDPDGKIPASLKSKLSDPSIGTPILAMANGISVDDSVRQLLVGLGYQLLPDEKPIVVQEAGVAIEAKGNWMALGPDTSNKTQKVLIINLTDATEETPNYLTTALAKHGLDLREIALPESADRPAKTALRYEFKSEPSSPRDLPRDKQEIVDALLLSFGVAFGVAETLSVELSDGLRVDTRADRIFELNGKRTALFFKPLDAAVRHALQERHGIQTFEIAIDALAARDVIARVLRLLDDQAVYREHRFPVAADSAPERLTLKAWGFHVPKRAMFVTDRQIPPGLHRFFFEKGMEIVYFH
jgi:hypothetical protein